MKIRVVDKTLDGYERVIHRNGKYVAQRLTFPMTLSGHFKTKWQDICVLTATNDKDAVFEAEIGGCCEGLW